MIQVIEEKKRGMVDFSKWDRGRSPTGKEEWVQRRVVKKRESVCAGMHERKKEKERSSIRRRDERRERENAIGWCRQEGLV